VNKESIVSRFTKGAAIKEIRARAEAHQEVHAFNLDHGSAQLWPRGADEKMKALIERAVAYGKFRALESVANDLECGDLGVDRK